MKSINNKSCENNSKQHIENFIEILLFKTYDFDSIKLKIFFFKIEHFYWCHICLIINKDNI